ncbi:hypothetical protein OESDEN_14662 [Oesophagostomum dentatum]|uniref:Uncharacterized protein n=1 Tax=Oesophagostomum dentatum TaxID=61180 RepID=A0A0B1SQ40_OESDE|nr:hypothetical protein OESDEN_14662 [Oesophagostomum dentatum]
MYLQKKFSYQFVFNNEKRHILGVFELCYTPLSPPTMSLFQALLVILPILAVKCELSCYGGAEASKLPIPIGVQPKSCPNATFCIE